MTETMEQTANQALSAIDLPLIRLAQLPVIEERLREVKDAWEGETKDNMALVCTADTIQSVKTARAGMTAKFNELETLRKTIKMQYMAPYDAFDATYKECITEPYKRSDAALKGKISDVETEIKQKCEDRLREYFEELCAAKGLAFLTFEQSGVKVDMASAKQKSPRKLMSSLKEFVERVECDTAAASAMEDGAAILAEYKGNGLNLALAVQTVKDRRDREEHERKAAEERAEAVKQAMEAVAKVDAALAAAASAPPVPTPVAVPAAQAEDDRVYRCEFVVHATKAQLRKIKDFLIQEGIRYE